MLIAPASQRGLFLMDRGELIGAEIEKSAQKEDDRHSSDDHRPQPRIELVEVDENAAQRIDRVGDRVDLDEEHQPFGVKGNRLGAGEGGVEREDRGGAEIERQDDGVGKHPEPFKAAHPRGQNDAERRKAEGEPEHQQKRKRDLIPTQGDIGKPGEDQDERAVPRCDGAAAEDLAEQDDPSWHGRDEDRPQEAELAVPDHRHRELDRGVHDVEDDHRREQELQIGVGDDEADLAIDLAAKIGVESDPQYQEPDEGPLDAADQLAAIANGAHHFAQPDAVKTTANAHDRAHEARSPARRP